MQYIKARGITNLNGLGDVTLKKNYFFLMRKRRLIPIAIFFSGAVFLSACQHGESLDAPVVHTAKPKRLSDAASFNTQLGLAYLKQGDRPRAKKKLFLALTQAPKSPEVAVAIAYFMEKSGEIVEAEKYYRKALTLAPKQGAQLNNYGTFLCRQGKYVEADAYFLKAISDVTYENTAAAYENAGLCAMAIPNSTKATHYYRKALEQDPSRNQSLYELVRIAINAHQFDIALGYLQQYTPLTMQDPTLLTLAADVARQAGNRDLEQQYKVRLIQLSNFSDNTGVKSEYNINNG